MTTPTPHALPTPGLGARPGPIRPDATRRPVASRRRRGVALALLVAAWPLMVALWVAVALAMGAPAAWMGIVVVADASVLLSLLRWPAGLARTALAVAFLLSAAAASLWVVAAGIVGPAFGLLPWESALRLGPVLFEAISAPWWTAGNAAWLAAALGLGLWWNR